MSMTGQDTSTAREPAEMGRSHEGSHPTFPKGSWLGKEMISLSPPPRRTVRTSHLVHGSSNLRTPRGALML